MFIEELIIEGFKSYATRTVVKGWDPSFTAITGLNGSGKSNILDALCFVLGIDNLRQIRATSMQDLVYKRGQAGINKATVTIVFNNEDKSQSPVGYKECKQIIICRQIVLGGKNKYMINGVNAQQHTVENLFQSVALNVNNPHFLIMQGRITKILNMKPQEIAGLIEETAGTRMYEDHQDKAAQTIAKKDKKLDEINELLMGNIVPRLEKLKEERKVYLEFQVMKNELEKMEKLVTAYEYWNTKSALDNAKNALTVKTAGLEDLKLSIQEKNEQLDLLAEKLEILKAEKKKRIGENTELIVAEEKVKEFNGLLAQLQSRLAIIGQQMQENEKSLGALLSKKRKLSSTKKTDHSISLLYEDLKLAYEDRKLELTKHEDLLNGLKTGITESKFNKTGQVGYAKLIADENQVCLEIQAEYEKNKAKLVKLDAQVETMRPLIPKLEQDREALKAELKNDTEKLENLRSYLLESCKISTEENELVRSKQSLESEISKASQYLSPLPEFQYTAPSRDFDDAKVFGMVYQLFNVKNEFQKFKTALEIVGGARLQNVVVASEKEASDLLERGNLKKRVTMLPLTKIQGYVIPEEKLHQVRSSKFRDSAFLALDLLEFRKEFLPAMKYIWGGTMLCVDKECAAYLAHKLGIKTVTIDGDVYDPSGTLTGGSNNTGNRNAMGLIEGRMQRILLSEKQQSLRSINDALARFSSARDRNSEVESQIELLNHSLKLKNKQLTQGAFQKLASFESMQREVESLRTFQLELKKRISSSTEKLQQYQRDHQAYAEGHDKAKQLAVLEERIKSLKKEVQLSQKAFLSAKEKKDAVNSETVALEQELGKLENDIAGMQAENEDLAMQAQELKERDVLVMELELASWQTKVLSIKEKLDAKDADLKVVMKEQETVKDDLDKLGRSKSILTSTLEKLKEKTSSLQASLDNLSNSNYWVVSEYHLFNKAEGPYNFSAFDMTSISTELKKQKGLLLKQGKFINTQVLDMISSVELKQSQLLKNLKIIEKDKEKIRATIEKLNIYKKEALEKTFLQVNRDFGEIFGELVPTGFAELAPSGGNGGSTGSITSLCDLSSLEIRIRLGTVWKSSLSELSGGQRSLVALSLLFSLLLTKPAPLYLLDEIDAALDISHTQTIGKLISSSRKFKSSQFIVISLKDGLFNNAPVLFRTSFKDGVSNIQRFTASEASMLQIDSSKSKGKKTFDKDKKIIRKTPSIKV